MAESINALSVSRFWNKNSAFFCKQSRYIVFAHVLCVDTGRSSETAKAHRG
eukprot:TRINITY_DN5625_c0_g1_i1.p6 TRINITY_DN5625_c0_g1~~TRINITY_DN5625_c0_g1_i1.p6  ORF type:complete len:51 (+),score=15.23 TRINITY_DN5625_c0_g1_i1:454-606(+)